MTSWNETKMKILLRAFWFVISIMITTLSSLHRLKVYSMHPYVNMVLRLTIMLCYIGFATFATCYLFHKFKKAKLNPCPGVQNTTKMSYWRVFLKSKFFVPVLFNLSFLIFIVFPGVAKIIFWFLGSREKDVSNLVLFEKISIVVFFLLNSIFILFQPKIRKYIKKC